MSEKKPQEASGENPNYDPYAEIEHYRQLAIEMEVKANALAAQIEQMRKLAFDSGSFVIDCALQSESPKQREMARIYHTDARGKGFYKIDKDKFDAILAKPDAPKEEDR